MGKIQFVTRGRGNSASDLADISVTYAKYGGNGRKCLGFSFSANAVFKAFKMAEYIQAGFMPQRADRIYFATATPQYGFKLSRNRDDSRYRFCPEGVTKRIEAMGFDPTDWIGEYRIIYDREAECHYIDMGKKIDPSLPF